MLRPVFSESGASVKSMQSTSKCTASRSQAASAASASPAAAAGSAATPPLGHRGKPTALDRLELARRALISGDARATRSGRRRAAATRGPKSRSSGVALVLAEHVRDAHPVERAVRDAVGRVEIAVHVEVDEPEAPARRAGARRPCRGRRCSRRRARARARRPRAQRARARPSRSRRPRRPRGSGRTAARDRAASARRGASP